LIEKNIEESFADSELIHNFASLLKNTPQ